MAINILKIRDVRSEYYEDRGGVIPTKIVIGMSNTVKSGYGLASAYRTNLYPKITYNYIIDKQGKIYEVVPIQYATFCINASNSDYQNDNKEAISICFMPTWNGSGGYYDDYESGSRFPKEAEEGQLFLLTKIINQGGTTYPCGLYEYKDAEWKIVETIDVKELKRPYKSEDWSIEDKCEKSLASLVKHLSIKENIPVSPLRILRVYDYYKTYNPAPYIRQDDDTDDVWKNFLDLVEDTTFETIFYNEEGQTIQEFPAPTETEEELIEKYGLDAGKDKDQTFKGNSIVDITQIDSSHFYFELGIHDTLETTIQDNGDTNKATTAGNLWSIANQTQYVEWTTHLQDRTDELSFSYYNKNYEIPIKEGFNVGYWLNGIGGFNGNIFRLKQSGDKKEIYDITCYGWLKYLFCDGWKAFTNKTASQIFDEVCNICGIPHRVINPSSYVVKAINCYGTSYYDMIIKAINETMVYEKKWYIIQPNFGTLEFRDILDPINIKQIKFSEDSAILNWDFESNIEDSANIVITYQEGEKDEKGNIQATPHQEVKDESSIKEWGRLQKIIKEEKTEDGKMKVSAEQWLKYYNSPRRNLKLKCNGIAGIIAGNIIYVEIYNVASVGEIKGCLIVDDCTHRIEDGKHTMELACEIVQDGTLYEQIYNAVNNEKKEIEEKTEVLESNTEKKQKTLDDYNNVIAPIIIWAINATEDRTKLNNAIYELVRHGEINLYWSNFIIIGNKYDYTKLNIFTNLTETEKQNAIDYIKTTTGKDISLEDFNKRITEITYIYTSCLSQNQPTVADTENVVATLDTSMQEKHDTESNINPITTDKSDVVKTIIATSSEAERVYKESEEYKKGLADGSIVVKRSDVFTTNKETSILEQLKQKTNFAGYEIAHIWQNGNRDEYMMTLTIDGRCIWVCFGGSPVSDFLSFEEAETSFIEFRNKVQERELWTDAMIKEKIDSKMEETNSYIGKSWGLTHSFTMTNQNFLKQEHFTSFSGEWKDIKGEKAFPEKEVLHFMKIYTEIHYACEGFAHKILELVFGERSLLFEDDGWGTFGDITNEVKVGDCICFKPLIGSGHIEFIKAIQDDTFSVIGGNVSVNGADGTVQADTRKKSFYNGFGKKNSYVSCTHIPINL